jgi:2-polyprenyl-3-methyl-5-hydroxy-6-metoxy-1,4-benzoquinol methylase
MPLINSKHKCSTCNSSGQLYYSNLKDHLFGSKGVWNIMKCNSSDCGMLWISPMPSENALIEIYRTYYTHNDKVKTKFVLNLEALFDLIRRAFIAYKWDYGSNSQSLMQKITARLCYLWPSLIAYLDASVFHLPYQPNGLLLEVGCGNGDMLKKMDQLGWQVEGLDFDPIAVDTAKKKGLNIHLGGLIEQKMQGGTFDAIVMRHVIEHVPNPSAVIAECLRILRPNGKLVIQTPNINGMGHLLFKNDWRGLEPPRHLHIFNKKSISSIAKQAGFNKIKVFTSANAAAFLFRGSNRIRCSRSNNMKDKTSIISWVFYFIMQEIEAVLIKIHPEFGEELVLIAEKN